MLAELDSDMLERRKEVRELNKEAKKEALQAKRALKKSSKKGGQSSYDAGGPKASATLGHSQRPVGGGGEGKETGMAPNLRPRASGVVGLHG